MLVLFLIHYYFSCYGLMVPQRHWWHLLTECRTSEKVNLEKESGILSESLL